MAKKPLIGIIMGSDSDYPVMEKAVEVCKEFNVEYEVHIVSAHRTPAKMKKYAESAVKRGLKVIIAGAGGAAHLPGMTAAFTSLPVIGVPVQTKILKGLDSLLSIVQMPLGVPVATVAVDGASNAALLSIQILALSNSDLSEKLFQYKKRMERDVLKKNKNLQKTLKWLLPKYSWGVSKKVYFIILMLEYGKISKLIFGINTFLEETHSFRWSKFYFYNIISVLFQNNRDLSIAY